MREDFERVANDLHDMKETVSEVDGRVAILSRPILPLTILLLLHSSHYRFILFNRLLHQERAQLKAR